MDYKRIDMHTHAATRRGPEFFGGGSHPTCEELIEMHKTFGIERALLMPLICVEWNMGITTNEEVIEMVKKYPDNFSWFCYIDPRQGNHSPDYDFTPLLEHYKSYGARGVGEMCSNLYFDDPYTLNLFKHCEACDMPVLFHMGFKGGEYGLCDDIGLPRLEKVLKMFPRLRLIGHSARFWSEISVSSTGGGGYPQGPVTPGRVVELMRKYQNLYGDLSAGSGSNAIMRDPEFGYKFLEEFSDRLFYATDICTHDWEKIKDSYVKDFIKYLDDGVATGKLSEEAHYKISRGNAEQLLGLK